VPHVAGVSLLRPGGLYTLWGQVVTVKFLVPREFATYRDAGSSIPVQRGEAAGMPEEGLQRPYDVHRVNVHDGLEARDAFILRRGNQDRQAVASVPQCLHIRWGCWHPAP
jgi:hypothetical protein